MKTFRFLPAVVALMLVSLPDRAVAIDASCYFVTSSGQRMNLGKLCGDEPPQSVTPSRKAVTSIVSARIKRRIASTPVIEVTFNGTHRFDMIVDTGASGTLITRSMADAIGAQPAGSIQAGIADGSVVKLSVAQVRSMSVNGITARNLKVAIADRMEIGLLGHDFFGNYDLKIKRDVVEFYPR